MKFRFGLATFAVAVTAICVAIVAIPGAYRWLVVQPRYEPQQLLVRQSTGERNSSAKEMVLIMDYLHILNSMTAGRVKDSPARSWRVSVATCRMYWGVLTTGDEPEYDDAQPWYSQANAPFDNDNFYTFCFDPDRLNEDERHYTNVMALRGEGTAFEKIVQGQDPRTLTPQAIVLVEVSPKLRCEWMQPFDLDIQNLPPKIGDPQGICGNFKGCFLVGFADGDVWILSNNTPFADLELFFQCESAAKHDRDAILGKYLVKKVPTHY